MEIHFSSNYKGKIELQIIDSQGNLVKKLSLTKDKYEMIIPLNLKAAVSGAYYYNIFGVQEKIIEGSFIIKK